MNRDPYYIISARQDNRSGPLRITGTYSRESAEQSVIELCEKLGPSFATNTITGEVYLGSARAWITAEMFAEIARIQGINVIQFTAQQYEDGEDMPHEMVGHMAGEAQDRGGIVHDDVYMDVADDEAGELFRRGANLWQA